MGRGRQEEALEATTLQVDDADDTTKERARVAIYMLAMTAQTNGARKN